MVYCSARLHRCSKSQLNFFTYRPYLHHYKYVTNHLNGHGTGVVICLERGANDLYVVQIMTLPPYHLFIEIQIGSAFLVPAYPVCVGKKPLNVCSVVVSVQGPDLHGATRSTASMCILCVPTITFERNDH